jgi:hypothetical protein
MSSPLPWRSRKECRMRLEAWQRNITELAPAPQQLALRLRQRGSFHPTSAQRQFFSRFRFSGFGLSLSIVPSAAPWIIYAKVRRFAKFVLRLCLNFCRFSTCRGNSSHAALIRANRLIPFYLIYQGMCISLARITASMRSCIVVTRLYKSSNDIC